MKLNTKTIIALLLAFGAAMQDPSVSGLVYKLTAQHPHYASVLTILLAIAAVLHNPQVEEALGINGADAK